MNNVTRESCHVQPAKAAEVAHNPPRGAWPGMFLIKLHFVMAAGSRDTPCGS